MADWSAIHMCIVILFLPILRCQHAYTMDRKTQMAAARRGNFLFYLPVVPKSTVMAIEPILRALDSRGHNVTLVTFVPKVKHILPANIKVIKLPSFAKIWNNLNDNFVPNLMRIETLFKKGELVPGVRAISELFHTVMADLREISVECIQSEEIAQAVKSADVTIVNFMGSESGIYLTWKYNVTLAYLVGQQVGNPLVDQALGQTPNPLTGVGEHSDTLPSFGKRLGCLTAFIIRWTFQKYLLLPQWDSILNDADEGLAKPSLMEMSSRAKLALSFGHDQIGDGLNRMSVPNYVHIGMLGCYEELTSAMPHDIKAFVESQSADENGVIVVAFGTVVARSKVSQEVTQVFLDVFGSLKQQVVWKWKAGPEDNIPGNVMVVDWLPQQALLAHTNSKIFITHAGQSSTQESWCHAVPTVVIPHFGDQWANAAEIVRVGTGIQVDLHGLNTTVMSNAIMKLLSDQSFTQQSLKLRNILLDQMNTPLEKAVWWLEYLVRHPEYQNENKLKNLPLHQSLMLDMVLFLAIIIMGSAYILFKCLVCCCCCMKTRKVKLKKE